MENIITSAAASKSPAQITAFNQCDEASCALERLLILLDTITELQRTACDDLPQGELRDRTLYEVFCLLLLLHDNMKVHSDVLGRIQASIAAERKAA